jgi:hypothetical protein
MDHLEKNGSTLHFAAAAIIILLSHYWKTQQQNIDGVLQLVVLLLQTSPRTTILVIWSILIFSGTSIAGVRLILGDFYQ